MGATQRYKQVQQQARVITNENGYLNGMYYTDVPLTEGYVKTLVNLDIDTMSGKLTPRPGLQTTGYYLSEEELSINTFSTQARTAFQDIKVCVDNYVADKEGAMDQMRNLHLVMQYPSSSYNGFRQNRIVVVPENFEETKKIYDVVLNYTKSRDNIKYGIHGKACKVSDYFKKPVGAFLGNQYFVFVDQKDSQGKKYAIEYTKLGRDITAADNRYIDTSETGWELRYYNCYGYATTLNPSFAATQGYNMLSEDPYAFKCEVTGANVVNILGVLPYKEDTNELILNPQLNETMVLRAYYTAPSQYITTEYQAKYYATSRQYVTGTIVEGIDYDNEDPDTLEDLNKLITISEQAIGNYWYVTKAEKYYIIKYKLEEKLDEDTQKLIKELTKTLVEFGTEAPKSSEKLDVVVSTEDKEETSVKIEWAHRQSTASDWTIISTETIKFSEQNNQPFICKHTLSAKESMVRVRVLDITPEGVEQDIVLATQTIGINVQDNVQTVAKKYALKNATGMCTWEQRLVVWGVPDALNMLFVSDVNNPHYFPYPNNTDVFPDPIMAAYNYGDELLVLTTNELYRLTWDTVNGGWTHTLVQRNLKVSEADLTMNRVIKNMFLFKSGEYYYMLVPKASSTVKGETTIAPISKPIEQLLSNFHEEIYKLIKLMSNGNLSKDFTDDLVYYYTYVDGSKLVLNYVYDLNPEVWVVVPPTNVNFKNTSFLYVQLIYDTDTRVWSLRTFCTPNIMFAPMTNSIQTTQFIMPILGYKNNSFVSKGIQRCTLQNTTDQIYQYIQVDADNKAVVGTHLIGNYQYLDTGNREIDTERKKRFREFQFKIKNINTTELAFHTGFYVDGAARQNILKYETSVDEYGNIIIMPVLKDSISYTVNGTVLKSALSNSVSYNADGLFMPTELGTQNSAVCWTAGLSAFPGRTLWKVRMPVNGKGYTPRAELLSRQEQQYEILGHSWVYRTMNGR